MCVCVYVCVCVCVREREREGCGVDFRLFKEDIGVFVFRSEQAPNLDCHLREDKGKGYTDIETYDHVTRDAGVFLTEQNTGVLAAFTLTLRVKPVQAVS